MNTCEKFHANTSREIDDGTTNWFADIMFFVLLKITYPHGHQLFKRVDVAASNWRQAHENAVNCYKALYPDCKVEAC